MKQRSGDKKNIIHTSAGPKSVIRIQIISFPRDDIPNQLGKQARVWMTNALVKVGMESFLPRWPGFGKVFKNQIKIKNFF
jgi:hypothetical protein